MRADRLISLMLLLNARGRMTARELAETLEVSERTIYRDLDALSGTGVPVYAQSGPNGGVFLDERYRVSLTGLSLQDVQALFVPGDLEPLKDLGLAKTDTLLKLFAALPSAQRSEVERLRQRIHIDTSNWLQGMEMMPFFDLMQQAVWEDRRVEVRYRKTSGKVSERTLDAYALVAKMNVWYLVANKPGDPLERMHTYRLSRFEQARLSEERFERDPGFDLGAYWRVACERIERMWLDAAPPYPALLRVHPDMFYHFPSYLEGRYEVLGEPDANGWKTLRVVFIGATEARMQLLGLGTMVEIIDPDDLRAVIAEAARSIAAYYGSVAVSPRHNS